MCLLSFASSICPSALNMHSSGGIVGSIPGSGDFAIAHGGCVCTPTATRRSMTFYQWDSRGSFNAQSALVFRASLVFVERLWSTLSISKSYPKHLWAALRTRMQFSQKIAKRCINTPSGNLYARVGFRKLTRNSRAQSASQ